MSNITISYLNSKAWYRLLKVVYITVFILFFVVGLSSIWDEVGSYQEDFIVSCNYGNKETFLAAKDKKIYISKLYDYTYSLAKLPDYTKEDLQSACSISNEEINTLLTKASDVSNNKKLFDLTKTKVNVTTYWDTIGQSILYLLIICVIFEIIKRVFYYVVLGSIKPKK